MKDNVYNHAAYDNNKLSELQKMSQECRADWLVTTQKDWVKLKEVLDIEKDTRGTKPHPTIVKRLHWVKIEMEIVEGNDKLCELINGVKEESDRVSE